jgi:cellulose biosynthesis protein BcsQ
MKVVGVYAIEPNMGKNTIATSLANLAAKNNFNTLFIELDYIRPSLASTNHITHPFKNAFKYFERAFLHQVFDIDNYILRPKEIKTDNKKVSISIKEIPENFHFLVFPSDYNVEQFPSISEIENKEAFAMEFVKTMIQHVRSLNYDLVVLNLPNELSDIFGLPVMFECDYILNLISPSLVNMNRLKTFNKIIEKINQDKVKWINILNQKPSEIDVTNYEALLSPYKIKHSIPYDQERLSNELNMKMGSELIDHEIQKILVEMGYPVQIENKKKGLLFF